MKSEWPIKKYYLSSELNPDSVVLMESDDLDALREYAKPRSDFRPVGIYKRSEHGSYWLEEIVIERAFFVHNHDLCQQFAYKGLQNSYAHNDQLSE